MPPFETAPEPCCRCGYTGRVYFDRHARGWFCRDGRECSLRVRRKRRNADADSRLGRRPL